MKKNLCIGDFILGANLIIIVGALVNFLTYVIYYLEFTKGFKIACAWFFGSVILELVLYSIKHS